MKKLIIVTQPEFLLYFTQIGLTHFRCKCCSALLHCSEVYSVYDFHAEEQGWDSSKIQVS